MHHVIELQLHLFRGVGSFTSHSVFHAAAQLLLCQIKLFDIRRIRERSPVLASSVPALVTGHGGSSIPDTCTFRRDVADVPCSGRKRRGRPAFQGASVEK